MKGGADVTEEVIVTPRGPVVSPAFGGVAEMLSLRAVWLDPLPVVGFFDAPRARSFDEFRRCLKIDPAAARPDRLFRAIREWHVGCCSLAGPAGPALGARGKA